MASPAVGLRITLAKVEDYEESPKKAAVGAAPSLEFSAMWKSIGRLTGLPLETFAFGGFWMKPPTHPVAAVPQSHWDIRNPRAISAVG
jgi:hypothetical protein